MNIFVSNSGVIRWTGMLPFVASCLMFVAQPVASEDRPPQPPAAATAHGAGSDTEARRVQNHVIDTQKLAAEPWIEAELNPDDAAEGAVYGGVPLLHITHESDGSLTQQLILFENPVDNVLYRLSGRVRYEGVEPAGYFTLTKVGTDFQRVTQNLSGQGSMSALKGSSDWRPFVFDWHPSNGADLSGGIWELALVLPGNGEVWIDPFVEVVSVPAADPHAGGASGVPGRGFAIGGLVLALPCFAVVVGLLALIVIMAVSFVTGKTRRAMVLLFVLSLLWVVLSLPMTLYLLAYEGSSGVWEWGLSGIGVLGVVLSGIYLHKHPREPRTNIAASGAAPDTAERELRKIQAMDLE